ncbi:cell wall hydrolase [Allosphingosinicella sp.]|jgi:spore germination cell wall hydrolase CwlJ-like protein|uniref:cell wall hydrolase n=1 Tax=Allosphingosinicella sp. TaxID=2823234 RepID=UPI002EEF8AC7
MIRTVRAAGFAAVMLGFALSFASPLAAFEGGSAAVVAAEAAALGTLDEQVERSAITQTADAEQDCLANAVYFEARGEPIEGQLAVAEVVLNRVASKRYPDTICEVVVQPAQFSFVRNRIIPRADRSSEAWRKAVAVARIAQAGTADAVGSDVLWYHADYVSPSWGRRLDRQDKIGLHIFYS